MLNERKAENKHPSDSPQASHRGEKGVNHQDFKEMVGDAIRRTISQYDSLLRYGLDHELRQIVQEYEDVTAHISTPIARGVKDRLIKMIQEEVRRSLDRTLLGAEGSLSDPMWLRAANKQWRADTTGSNESRQPSRRETPAQSQPQPETPPSEEVRPGSGLYKYRMAGVPPIRQRPVNLEAQQQQQEPEQEPPSEETRPGSGLYKYRMAGVPPIQRRPVNLEAQQQQQEPEQEPPSEETHPGSDFYKYRMAGVPPIQRRPVNLEAQQHQEPEQKPPSEETHLDSDFYKYWMERIRQIQRRAENVEPSSPQEPDVTPLAPPGDSDRHWAMPEETGLQSWEEPGLPAQTEISDAPDTALDHVEEVVELPAAPETVISQQPVSQEDLDTAIVHVENAVELLAAPEMVTPQKSDQEEDMAESESSEVALVAQERPAEITPPSSSFWVLPNTEGIEEREIEDELSTTVMLPQPLTVEEAEEEHDEGVQEAVASQSALPAVIEHDEEPKAEDSEEEVDAELPQEQILPEEQWSEGAVNAVLDDIGYFKTVVHDNSDIVHIAPAEDDEAVAEAEEVALEYADEEHFEPHDDVSQVIAVAEGEEEALAVVEEPEEIAETIEAAEESSEGEAAEAEVLEQGEDDYDTSIAADDIVTEAVEQETDTAESPEMAEQSEDVQEETAEPINQEEEPEEAADSSEEAEQLDEAEDDLDEMWAEDDDLTEIVDDDEELTEETVTKVMFEGTVRLNVEANGCIKEIVHFVRELRQNPQLRLLRLVGNNKMGVDIWLGLREPLRLKAMLPELEGVSIVTKPLPHVGSPNERLLSVRLSPLPDHLADSEEEAQDMKEAEPIGAAKS